jgi:hypothetical protein
MKREYRNESGQLHREDGPAVENAVGRSWWINGQLHRTDGPAIEWSSGSREWWINGKCHREDGPALISVYGIKFWYLNSKNYTKEQHQEELIKLKLKRLVEL